MKPKLKKLKMKKRIFVLVFFTSLFLIISVYSQQFRNDSESVSNVRMENIRVAKYDRLFWAPSDITVRLKNEPMSHREQEELSRVKIEGNSIHRQHLPATSTRGIIKSRALESYERKHSGNFVSLEMLTS